MSRNGSGTYNLPAGINPVQTGTTITTNWANTTLNDIASALTGSIAADGQTPITGNLDMGSNKLTNLVAGSASGDSVEFAQFTTPTFTGDVTCESTGFILVPKGTTAERPLVPVEGEIRYNTDTAQFEGYADGDWGQLGGGATGGGGDQVFVENSMVVTTSYAIPSGKSASSVGAITIDSGVTVTIPDGSRWVVL